jgi:polysaccharide biosynthesis/export protein
LSLLQAAINNSTFHQAKVERHGRRFMAKLRWRIVAASILLFSHGSVLGAEYTIQPGDLLEFSIVGTDIKQRTVVGLEGQVSVPLVGQLKVAGLTLSDVIARVKADLPNRVYQQRTTDGREVSQTVAPDMILVNLEYRPVYLNGDVSRPGEQSFRPGMTVRQAIALTGGYDLIRFRMNNPVIEGADLRAEHESLWAELVREQARLWRLRTELGQKTDATPADLAPIPVQLRKDLIGTEVEQLSVRNAAMQKERQYLERQVKMTQNNLSALVEKRKKDEEASQADAADYDRFRELLQRGLNTNMRISEARRALLYSSTQALNTFVQITQSERQSGEYGRSLERLEDQRREELMKEMQDTLVRLASIRARLRSASEKLLYTSTVQSQLVRGSGGRPQLTIVRSMNGSWDRLPAHEDTELFPGDVVEVQLQVGDPGTATVE